jgi:hypothetical protein
LERELCAYKQAGVEASVEIQNAARHVLEENERLRALLDGYPCLGRKRADFDSADGGLRVHGTFTSSYFPTL